MSDRIFLARLSKCGINRKTFEGDPWGDDFHPDMVFEGEDLCEESFGWNEGYFWAPEKHAARIRFIMQSKEDLACPIVLECTCHAGSVLPWPVVLDGWHRLHAHWALGRRKISAEFGGRLDLLDYLRGITDKQPEE